MGHAGYRKLREDMVDTQLIPRGIRSPRVLDAMRRVPRHLFVEPSTEHLAYADMALPIGEGQTISQPYMVAIMTELLELTGAERVLEIGTGSGYQAAILAELSADVFTIERVVALYERTSALLKTLHYDNIHARAGDGTLGWLEEAPFDRIMLTAAAPDIPQPLLDQLAPDGLLLAPVGSRFSQELVRIRHTAAGYVRDYHTPCVFVPLIGEHGWKEA